MTVALQFWSPVAAARWAAVAGVARAGAARDRRSRRAFGRFNFLEGQTPVLTLNTSLPATQEAAVVAAVYDRRTSNLVTWKLASAASRTPSFDTTALRRLMCPQ